MVKLLILALLVFLILGKKKEAEITGGVILGILIAVVAILAIIAGIYVFAIYAMTHVGQT